MIDVWFSVMTAGITMLALNLVWYANYLKQETRPVPITPSRSAAGPIIHPRKRKQDWSAYP